MPNFKQIRQQGAAAYRKECMDYTMPADGLKEPTINRMGGDGGVDLYPIKSEGNFHPAPNTPLSRNGGSKGNPKNSG